MWRKPIFQNFMKHVWVVPVYILDGLCTTCRSPKLASATISQKCRADDARRKRRQITGSPPAMFKVWLSLNPARTRR